ncbi:MAG: AAA-like domain-containing protein [Synechococcales cyanobacterium K44_A2020_017]|nr:AAA-like domain-containing protein [Synechococcales cyanobacterium K32_A2020_035]MBF2093152.1 AAA-like domain-containing protein [Synechococcales cyanobacterium K44_A2020_017]
MNDQQFDKIVDRLNALIAKRSSEQNPLKPLTTSEREVLRLMVDTNNNSALIQEKLDIKPGTLRKHRQNIYGKLSIEGGPGKDHDVQLLELVKEQQKLELEQLTDLRATQVSRSDLKKRCVDAIQKPGALIRIVAPRRMGKTYLATQITQELPKDVQVVNLTFLDVTQEELQISGILKWLCISVASHMEESDSMIQAFKQHWDNFLSPNMNATSYFEKYLLSKIHKNLILVLDDIDRIFEGDTLGADFSALLRSWHEKARKGDASATQWEKLGIIIIQSSEIYATFDIHTSPLANVGYSVHLPELKEDEVIEMAQNHGIRIQNYQAMQLIHEVGGNPYLIKRALEEFKNFFSREEHLSSGKNALTFEQFFEQFIREAPTEIGIYRSHFEELRVDLVSDEKLCDEFRTLLLSDNYPKLLDPGDARKLEGIGLVKRGKDGRTVVIGCNLYRKYFYPLLVEQ